MYDSLVDPYARNIQGRIEQIKQDAHHSHEEERSNIQGIFQDEFLYWTEQNFKSLPRAIISAICDC